MDEHKCSGGCGCIVPGNVGYCGPCYTEIKGPFELEPDDDLDTPEFS